MGAQLYRYHSEMCLSLGEGKAIVLTLHEVKEFLKNYDSQSFYDSLLSKNAIDFVVSEGELLAEVDEHGYLVINHSSLIRECFSCHNFPYLTTEEYAAKHNRKQSIVLRHCRDGRLEGALQKNTVWLIPSDTPYPADARVGARVPSARTRKKQ